MKYFLLAISLSVIFCGRKEMNIKHNEQFDSYLNEKRFMDLTNADIKEIELLHEEIFARHGQSFRNNRLQSYFDAKTWYRNSGKETINYDSLTIKEKNISNLLNSKYDSLFENMESLYLGFDFKYIKHYGFKIIGSSCIALISLTTENIGDNGLPYEFDYYYLTSFDKCDSSLFSSDGLNANVINSKIKSKAEISVIGKSIGMDTKYIEIIDPKNIRYIESKGDQEKNIIHFQYNNPSYADGTEEYLFRIDSSNKMTLISTLFK